MEALIVILMFAPLAVIAGFAMNSAVTAEPVQHDTITNSTNDAHDIVDAQNDYRFEILTEATKGLTLKHFSFRRTENGTTTISFDNIEDETAKQDWTHAKKELRLVKSNVTTARKDIHEQLQEMRREYRNERANMAPTLRGGGKYGRWIRAAQHLNRYAQRRGHVNSLETYEMARELYDEILEGMDKLRNVADGKLLELA
jgi:flagellar biosynthesis chaperone FliJ